MTTQAARRLFVEKGGAKFDHPDEMVFHELSNKELIQIADTLRENGVPDDVVQEAMLAELTSWRQAKRATSGRRGRPTKGK